MKNHNCAIYGFDPSPKSIKWITAQQLPANFKFESIGIGQKTGKATFNLPKIKEYVSGSLYNHDSVDPNHSIEV